MERDEFARIVFALVLTVGVFWGLYTVHSPNQVQMTEATVIMGGEAQSSVPPNATVYGQSNLTAKEYKLFQKNILGEKLVFDEEGSQISDKRILLLLRRTATSGLSQTGEEEDSLRTMVNQSYRADYLQADGHYYPVLVTQETFSRTAPWGGFAEFLGYLSVVLFVLMIDTHLIVQIEDDDF